MNSKKRLDIVIVLTVGFLVFAVGGLVVYQIQALGAPTQTETGTILSSYENPKTGFWLFGYCLSIPNCGYVDTVRLDNGSMIQAYDTCAGGEGMLIGNISFSYYPKIAQWQQATVICD